MERVQGSLQGALQGSGGGVWGGRWTVGGGRAAAGSMRWSRNERQQTQSRTAAATELARALKWREVVFVSFGLCGGPDNFFSNRARIMERVVRKSKSKARERGCNNASRRVLGEDAKGETALGRIGD